MLNMVKKSVKNERGLTLIELLAVVVILGIIAAIAIPSIGGLINNSRADAHIANGQQMVAGARLAMTAGQLPADGNFTIAELVADGYLEPIDSPSNPGYAEDNSLVAVTQTADGLFEYTVTLVDTAGGVHYAPIDIDTLTRDGVEVNP